MKVELAIPADWVTTRAVHDGNEVVVVAGGLEIELGTPVPAPADATSMLEALVTRDPVEGATVERAGHVTGRTTEGVPFTLSSVKFRDASKAVVEGRLIAYYVFGDIAATVCCRMRAREALVKYGPSMDALLTSARLDRGASAPRVDDLMN